MTTSTIVWIVVVVVAAVLLVAAIAWVARKKRTEHRRVQAGDIRDKAVEQSHEVGQREALADETAAKARAAQAEAEAMAAHSAGLQHQAQARHTDAATSRSEREPRVRARRQDRSGLANQRYAARRCGRPARPTTDTQGRVTFRRPGVDRGGGTSPESGPESGWLLEAHDRRSVVESRDSNGRLRPLWYLCMY